jgi:hypothetical protein
VLPALQKVDRGAGLCEDWKSIKKTCEDIADNPALLTGYIVLGESLHPRAPTPVLSMVAVDLMLGIERLCEKLVPPSGATAEDTRKLYQAWCEMFKPIVYFRLAAHVGPNSKNFSPSNDSCWTVFCAPLLTRLC